MANRSKSPAGKVSATTEFWHRIIITEAATLAELLTAFLFELDATGVEEHNADLIAYFPSRFSLPKLETQLNQRLELFKRELNLDLPLTVFCQRVAQENWQLNWMLHFKPIAIGERFLVTPSWEKVTPAPNQIVLTIDPEQAFGTGHHATTAMMLTALLQYWRPGQRVLDVGTGSGILAIAAARLGSDKIIAFDLDPVAVITAAQNAQRNDVAKQIQFYVGELSVLSPQKCSADLILANLSTGVLRSLLPRLRLYLRGLSSVVILSGILAEEREKLNAWLTDLRFTILAAKEQEEWLCLICTTAI